MGFAPWFASMQIVSAVDDTLSDAERASLGVVCNRVAKTPLNRGSVPDYSISKEYCKGRSAMACTDRAG